MAIKKVGTYRNPPEDITDYQAIAAHLDAYTRQIGNQGMILTEWANTTGTPAIAMGSYISHGGVLYVVSSEEAVSLPVADGTYYLKVAASGDTLVLSWISDLSGYAWNAVHNGLYHADESQVLPYQVVKSGALIEKYKMLNPWQNDDFAVVNYLGRYRELRVTGAISGASLGVDNLYNPRYIIYDGSKGNTDFKVINSQVGAYSIGSVTSDNAYITTSTYTKKREIVSKATGTVRVSHFVRASDNRTVYTRVYINGIAVGVEHQLVASSSDVESQTFTDDILVEYGDLVQIYGKVSVPSTTNVWVGNTNIMCNVRASLE